MAVHQFDIRIMIDTDDLAQFPQRLLAEGQRLAQVALERDRLMSQGARPLTPYVGPSVYRPKLTAAQKGKQSYRQRHKRRVKTKRVSVSP